MTNPENKWPAAWPALPADEPDIRLVALDLDDTLLNDDLIITPRTKKAIQAARETGVTVTIATGRVFESALPYARELDIDVPLITFQGAMVVAPDGQVISHRPMDREVSLEILDFLLSFGYHVTLYIKDKLYIEETSPETDRYRARIRINFNVVPSLKEMLAARTEGVTKFVLMAEEEQIKEALVVFRERFGDRAQAVLSKPTFLEISRPDTGKGVALAEMAEAMGIDRGQVMAVGDSPNDLDMITYAGWGVCMANGVDSVKEKARWITASNNDEGVAVAFEELVLKSAYREADPAGVDPAGTGSNETGSGETMITDGGGIPDENLEIWIITGLSGAGKTNAIRAFEDWNYLCIDNLPPALLADSVAMIRAAGNIRRLALGVDIRSQVLFDGLMPALEELEKREGKPNILFLDADAQTLIKRFKETRRRHPLASEGELVDIIQAERGRLEVMREKADVIIDTSNLKPKDLMETMERRVYSGQRKNQFKVHIISFGYKYGIPMDADLLMDVRFLPNPHYVDGLQELTGLDAPVRDFVMRYEVSREFFNRFSSLLTYLIPKYIEEGKTSLVVGIGCTGGRHRSVTLAEKLRDSLTGTGFSAAIHHRDINR